MIPLDRTGEGLTSAATLAIARRHPAALPFLCAVQLPLDETATNEIEKRLRHAFEEVTDLRERESAILRGHRIEDLIRVFLSFTLGSNDFEDAHVAKILASIRRISSDFFSESRFEVHSLVFMPDLMAADRRTDAYANAYRQLATLDGLVSSSATGLAPATGIDFHWILDCRTQSGAHAGALMDLIEPAAEMVAVLLEDPEAAGVREGPGSVPPERNGRPAVYSTFGLAALDHRPDLIVRMVAAEVALKALYEYSGGSTGDSGIYVVSGVNVPDAEVERVVQSWAGAARVQERLTDVVHPDLPEEGPKGRPVLLQRQRRFRRDTLEVLRKELEAGVQSWLAAGGIPLAEACCGTLSAPPPATEDEETVGALLIPELSLSELYSSLRQAITEALPLDALDQRLGELTDRANELEESLASAERVGSEAPPDTTVDRGDGDGPEVVVADLASPEVTSTSPGDHPLPPADGESNSNRSVAEPLQAELDSVRGEIAGLETQKARCVAAAELRISPHALETLLREVEEQYGVAATRSAGTSLTRPSSSGPLPHEPVRHRIAQRLLRFSRRRRMDPPARTMEEAEEPSSHAQLPRTPRHWVLAERFRWLRDYEGVLVDIRTALQSHRGDIADAIDYYHGTAEATRNLAVRRTPFRVSPLGKADLQRIATEFTPGVRAVLFANSPATGFAEHFRAEIPVLPEHTLRHVERLDGFDGKLMHAAYTAMLPFLERTLGDVLVAAESTIGERVVLRNLVRMLVEASEPLARPSARNVGTLWMPERWLRGDSTLIDLLSADEEATDSLWRASVTTTPTGPCGFGLFGSVVHGFPAHALTKVVPLRGYASASGDAGSTRDLVPAVAVLEGAGGQVLRALVLGEHLGILERSGNSLNIDGTTIPADTIEATRALMFSPDGLRIAARLERRIDELLQESDAGQRLQQVAARLDITSFEYQVIVDMLANLRQQPHTPAGEIDPSTQAGGGDE